MSIAQYFRAAQQLVQEIEIGIQELEDTKHRKPTPQIHSPSSSFSSAATGGGGGEGDADTLLEELEVKVKDLQSSVRYLQGASETEIGGSSFGGGGGGGPGNRERRDLWRNRIQALLQDCQNFNAQLLNFRRWRQSVRDADRKAILLGTGHRNGGVSEHQPSYLRNQVQQQESLLRSRVMIEEQVAIGRDALTALTEQRRQLRSAKSRVLDIGRSLGVSHSILRVIERQDFTNRIIAFTGMLGVLLIIFLTYYFVHHSGGSSGVEAAAAASPGSEGSDGSDLVIDTLDFPKPAVHSHQRRLLYL